MIAVLSIILPIFALILAGWGARRLEVLGPTVGPALNRFVVWLALPALMFATVAQAKWAQIWQPGLVLSLGVGIASIFVLTVAISARRRPLADAAVDGMNAAYSNSAYIGFPLALAAIGPEGPLAAAISSILTICLLFAAALVVMEFALQTERRPLRLTLGVAKAVARNPLVVAPAAGAVFLGFGIPVPAPASAFLKLLGAAASPCALVALGLFLAEKRPRAPGGTAMVAALVLAKLIVMPAITWAVARAIGLPPVPMRAAVLLAALPTGTGPFMIAEFYGREAAVTSRVILFSTIISVMTLAVYLSLSA